MSTRGTPERLSKEHVLNQTQHYAAPLNQSLFYQRPSHGAIGISRSREILAQSAASGVLRPKNSSGSQGGMTNLLHPHARAASSRSPSRGNPMRLQGQTAIYMQAPGPETSVARRKGIIRNLKSANPARYQLLSQRTKGLGSMLGKVNHRDHPQNLMFGESQ